MPPDFMAKAPWYMDTGAGPTLSHHKSNIEYNADPSKLEARYQKKVVSVGICALEAYIYMLHIVRAPTDFTAVQSAPITKFRKGACPNCGGLHKEQDCLERPRKVKAKYSGKGFANDEEVVATRKDDYDSKRDRWDGYDPAMYRQVVEEHQALEEARRKLREEEIDKTTDLKTVEKVAKAGKGKKKAADDDFGSSDESDEDVDERYAEGADAVGQKVDTKTRITVRNLRIREDTAKYLLNLDVDSAYYDPKTRSMRENPNPEKAPTDLPFAGENFVRHSGDANDAQRLQLFAWQAEQRGNIVHANSNPTQAMLIYKDYLERKEKLKDTSKTSILDKYGGEEHLQQIPKELLAGQTENYVEYSRTGKLIKGEEKVKARSKYDEDVYPGNHKSIWGSWFNLSTFKWGYACCHSYIKQSYCAGQAGIEAEKEQAAGVRAIAPPPKQVDSRSLAEIHASKTEEQRKKEKEEHDAKLEKDGKGQTKRKADDIVTDGDMEEYYKKKSRGHLEDPLANVGNDELLPL